MAETETVSLELTPAPRKTGLIRSRLGVALLGRPLAVPHRVYRFVRPHAAEVDLP
jgi:hypothetical protein